MNSPFIKQYSDNKEIFRLFVEQLTKDFQGAGLILEDSLNLPQDFELLKKSLQQQLVKTGKSSQAAINGLIYRVDISEMQLAKSRKNNFDGPFEELLADLIIKRVLQKVILKRNFSG